MYQKNPITYLGNFINGEFFLPQGSKRIHNYSPANLEESVFDFVSDHSHVEQACEAAFNAFPAWSAMKIEDRMNILNRVKEIFVSKQDEFAEVISRETGKPLWETVTEAKAIVAKFDVTFNYSLDLIKEIRVEKATPTGDGFIRYQPRGVFAVLGPFNFPAHLPNGHIVPALITGNCVVFKPSEFTPATAQLMAQCYQEAGVPEGVFNLVQGAGEVGRRLVTHKKIDGILFTGSYETGLKITESTVQDYWKIRALEMGGKNSTIVWNDTDLEKAVYESLVGVFLSTGQRCSCTSRLFLHKDIAPQFTEMFYEKAKKLTIGHWSENPFMGPLINEKSLDTYIRFQDIAIREGAEKIMRGKAFESDYKGYYVTPSIYKVNNYDPQSTYQNTEIFGPNAAIYEIEDLDEAIQITNDSGFGLSMAIFTKEKENYLNCLQKAKVGLLNWNRTTNGASSKLPFGGCGKSGNDRPSAHFAVYYCTRPVASIEDTGTFDPKNNFPGMNW